MFTTVNSNPSDYNTWIKTDDGQWVYRQDLSQFWIAQIRLWLDDYCATLNFIDLDTYDIEDIRQTMQFYGYEQDISEIDPQIIAECLAEEIDDFNANYKGTYKECERWIEGIIKIWGKNV